MTQISNPYSILKQQLSHFQINEEELREKLNHINQTRNKINNEIVSLTKDYEKKIKQLQNKLDEAVAKNQVLIKENKLYKKDIEAIESRLVEKEKLISMLILQQGERISSESIVVGRSRAEYDKNEKEREKVLKKNNYENILPSNLNYGELTVPRIGSIKEHQQQHEHHKQQKSLNTSNQSKRTDKRRKQSDKGQQNVENSHHNYVPSPKAEEEEQQRRDLSQNFEVSQSTKQSRSKPVPPPPSIKNRPKPPVPNVPKKQPHRKESQPKSQKEDNIQIEESENYQILQTKQKQNIVEEAIEKPQVLDQNIEDLNEDEANYSKEVKKVVPPPPPPKNKRKSPSSRPMSQQQKYLEDENQQDIQHEINQNIKEENEMQNTQQQQRTEEVQPKQQSIQHRPPPRKPVAPIKAKSKQMPKHQPIYFSTIQNENELEAQPTKNQNQMKQNTQNEETQQESHYNNPYNYEPNASTEDFFANLSGVEHHMMQAQESSIDYADSQSIVSSSAANMLDSQYIPQEPGPQVHASEMKKMPKKKQQKRQVKSINPDSFA